MKFYDVVSELLGTSRFVMTTYLSDLSDKDILVRPAPGAHHAAWQLGHLILSERMMIEGVVANSCPVLPNGFQDAHGKERGLTDAVEGYLRVQEYIDLMNAQRAATLSVAQGLTESRLCEPAPEFMRAYAPLVRSVFLSVGGHEYMHAGQIAVIRRHLGKPVLI